MRATPSRKTASPASGPIGPTTGAAPLSAPGAVASTAASRPAAASSRAKIVAPPSASRAQTAS